MRRASFRGRFRYRQPRAHRVRRKEAHHLDHRRWLAVRGWAAV